MPIIQVSMITGRSREKKRALAKALTDAFVTAAGAKPESVQVIIHDVEKDDWATAGALVSDRQNDQSKDQPAGS